MRYLLLLLVLVGCSPTTPEMEKYRKELEIEIKTAQGLTENLKQSIQRQRQEIDQLKVEKAIKQDLAVYILELELSQSHFTLNLDTHISDSMNTVIFELAVDKRLYDTVKKGDSLLNEFRDGSFLMKGSIGDWHIKVKNKKIKTGE